MTRAGGIATRMALRALPIAALLAGWEILARSGAVTPFTDPELERAIQKLSRRVPMRVDEHEIVLHGSCEDCAN